jgi:glycosyltransferase involved in cell wall biosynthesis
VSTAHFVVPDSIDDPMRPSGGNVYDRKIIRSLAGAGWEVQEHAVAAPWSGPDPRAGHALGEALGRIPEDSVVVVDGLLAATAPSAVVPAAARLRLVVLVHLPLGHNPPGHELPQAREHERAVLAAAAATITTSEWARRLLLRMYDDLDPRRVHVVAPGVDAAPPAAATPHGGHLLCVAAVTWHKGLDLLLSALSMLADLSWHCTCVGGLDREPAFAETLRRDAARGGLADRITFTGPLVGAELDGCYSAADLLVSASRGETYGMVVAEAIARGVPVVATAVGGVPDTVGCDREGHRPGLLVPPEDPLALAAAIRRWLDDESLRVALRRSAMLRRAALPSWAAGARQVAAVLEAVAA